MIEVVARPDGFDVLVAGLRLIAHRHYRPFLHIGRGEPRIDMYRGNFDIRPRAVAQAVGRQPRRALPEGLAHRTR